VLLIDTKYCVITIKSFRCRRAFASENGCKAARNLQGKRLFGSGYEAVPLLCGSKIKAKGYMFHKILSTCVILAVPLVAAATEYQTVERPRQECWNEQVPVQSASQGYGGAIVGGIAGGILGNQVGSGNGKTIATAVGAATGAVVGDRMASQDSSRGISYQTVQRCRTVVDHVQVPIVHERSKFCPPGQAKKGNC